MGDLALEVIVVMDDCDDGTAELLNQLARLRLRFRLRTEDLRNPRRGHAAAVNVGFRAAGAPKILLLDDDRIVNPSYIRAMSEPICPGVVTVAKGVGDEPISPDKETFEALGRPADWRESASMGMARGDLFAVGGMDENLQRWGYKDIDLGVRLWMYGCDFLYVPQASYFHLTNVAYDRQLLARRDVDREINRRYLSHRFGIAFPPEHLVGLRFRYPNDAYFEAYRQCYGFLRP